MISKTVEYVDYDGNKRKETHYFHLNKAELTTWLITNGDYTLDKVLERLYHEHKGSEIMAIFEDLLRRSYGRKSLDGRKFEKNDEIWEDFHQTEAYSEIFMELVSDSKKAAEFINKVVPENIGANINEIIKNNPDAISDELKDYLLDIDEAGNKVQSGLSTSV